LLTAKLSQPFDCSTCHQPRNPIDQHRIV